MTRIFKSILLAAGLLFSLSAHAQSASFIGTDTTTQGNWESQYGADGVYIPSITPDSISYGLVANQTPVYVWNAATLDPRAMQDGTATRVASTWFAAPSFTFNISITDGGTHQLALYALDWDNQGRSENISISNTANGAVLNTQSLSGFTGGTYLVWNVAGNITVSVTVTGKANAVVSGVFFGGKFTGTITPPPPPPSPAPSAGSYTVAVVTTPAAPSHSVVLAWTPVSAATYNVYRASNATGATTKLNASPVSATYYQDLAVSAGQSYFYTTTSIVGGVESAPSVQVPVTIPTP